MQLTWLVTTVKCRVSLGWAGHVAGMGDRRNACRIVTTELLNKFYSHQLMHFLIQPCINLLSYVKIT